jgi:hypothetical protein
MNFLREGAIKLLHLGDEIKQLVFHLLYVIQSSKNTIDLLY